MEELLRVEDLRVSYPGFELNNISFTCHKGEFIGVIGVNGAGKSTTIKAIMQMIARDNGDVYWKNEKVTEKKIAVFREYIGYVGDNDCYYPNIKVSKILRFVSELYDNWDYETMEEYLRIFKLNTNKKMKELSTGMRVKLDLLMAMSHNAELYILDEPTSGLDPFVRKEVIDILYDLVKREGKAVILSSHITSDLEKTADRILYLVDGAVVVDNGVNRIRSDFAETLSKAPKDVLLEDVLFHLMAR